MMADWEKRNRVKDKLQKMAKYLNARTPTGWGFALMMFEFGDDGDNFQWVSNAGRADMVKALREYADCLEARIAGGPGDDIRSHS